MQSFFKQGDFSIDPNTTPEMLKAKRERLAKMMPQYGKAQYIGEGLGQLFYGIGEGRQSNAMDKFEGEQRKGASDAFETMMRGGGGPLSILGMREADNGAGGGGYTPQPQTEADVLGNDVMGVLGKPSQDGMGPKIVETANALGMDPVDLATIISYETAGTFDPTKAGPTTQWGQHKGLIQFGEPQAKQYGVDWNDPEGSQLGADGAVAKYFKANGWQPGMGMMDAYSIVNAGGPGRYNASDANNGGAPGTVADKVNAQMSGHRTKAQAMLGGTYAPQGSNGGNSTTPTRVAGNGGPDLEALMQAAANPWLTPEQRGVVTNMIQQQQARQQAAEDRYWKQQDPAYQQSLQLGEIQLEKARNPEPDKGTATMQEYNLAKSQGFEGTFTDYKMAISKAGATNNTITVGGEPTVGADESELRKKLGGKEGEYWAAALDQGVTSAGTMQDMQLLDEIITMAPQGPIQGRLANAFPGMNSAADAFNSVVKRVAPTLRAPGSGSTSDIEYDGMLKSLPQLSSRPEANTAISAMMKAKSAINIERAQIVRDYQNEDISVKKARELMSALDKRSIMTPELSAILSALGPAPEQGGGNDDAEFLKSLGLE